MQQRRSRSSRPPVFHHLASSSPTPVLLADYLVWKRPVWDDFQEFFEVNTYSVMRLYLAVYSLLKAAAEKKGPDAPKFIGLSTLLEENVPFQLGCCGASKAAVNYIVRRAHAENEWLTAFLLEPG